MATKRTSSVAIGEGKPEAKRQDTGNTSVPEISPEGDIEAFQIADNVADLSRNEAFSAWDGASEAN